MCALGFVLPAGASPAPILAPSPAGNPAGIDWQALPGLQVARTETTVAQLRRWVQATGTRTAAEQRGGGEVYEAGWVRKPGWVWNAPFGRPAADDEPAVHVTWHEAQAFCRWAGGRLPRDDEWARAAYTEQRERPAAPFVRGRAYAFPTGDTPAGAICLGDCGAPAVALAVAPPGVLTRGAGHAPAGRSAAGVNGLFDMGGNAWEWVDDRPDPARAEPPEAERRTRGGSWWYGAGPMRAEHHQAKAAGTSVAYIGFRCVRG